MSDFKQIFSDEIRRLSRKEIKLAIAPLCKTIALQRQAIVDLRHALKALEKAAGKTAVAVPAEVKAEETPKIARRITDKRIAAMRNKMKFSQAHFAALLGVSLSSVVNWESGRSVPRPAQKEKIAELRTLGKREIAKRLEAAGISGKKARKGAAKKAGKAVAAAPAAAPAPAAPAAETK